MAKIAIKRKDTPQIIKLPLTSEYSLDFINGYKQALYDINTGKITVSEILAEKLDNRLR